ncbi:MAG: hypothetical protein JJU28_09890 [Cyclobacteriaceae bacterium]|nr:hypothetical protein [Cyclobacteriaceae bacterium]
MKRLIILLLFMSVFLGSCIFMLPRNDVRIGMSERQFLRRHPQAVISSLDRNIKVYRLQRDDYFFALATFEEGRLVHVEERELPRRWPGPGEIYFDQPQPRP